MLKEVQRDLGLTVLLVLSAALLLYLVVRDFGTGMPELPRAGAAGVSPATRLPAREFQGLFGTDRVPALQVPTNQLGAFYTLYFQPPPKPQPPPPTTRRVEMTYLGYFEAGGKPRSAIVRLGDAQAIVPVGSNLVANVSVNAIELRTLVLTNTAGVTNWILFNVKTNLEVPIP